MPYGTTGQQFCPYINDKGIASGLVATGAISKNKIAAYAVTSIKIGTGAVSKPKIAAYAVTNAKIGTNAVSKEKIAANAVTNAKIGTNAVSKEKIAANAVTNAKIASGTISLGSGVDGANVGRLNAKYVTCTFAGTTAQAVTHGLGRTPIGYIPVWLRGKTASIRLATTAASAMTASVIHIRPSATCVAMLWIF
jgi:hypothetical protein